MLYFVAKTQVLLRVYIKPISCQLRLTFTVETRFIFISEDLQFDGLHRQRDVFVERNVCTGVTRVVVAQLRREICQVADHRISCEI